MGIATDKRTAEAVREPDGAAYALGHWESMEIALALEMRAEFYAERGDAAHAARLRGLQRPFAIGHGTIHVVRTEARA